MSELEERLRRLGDELAWPATPELPLPPPRPAARGLPRARLALAIAGLVVLMLSGGALALPAAREAVLDWIGIGGVEVRRVPERPRAVPADYGPTVSLAQAEARTGRPLVRARALGEPGSVHVRQGVIGLEVTLIHGSLRLTQVAGNARADVVAKQVGPGTRVEPVIVNGERGVWIAGEPHGAAVQGSPLRLAGDTLVWGGDGLVLRLEGAGDKHEALRIARTVR